MNTFLAHSLMRNTTHVWHILGSKKDDDNNNGTRDGLIALFVILLVVAVVVCVIVFVLRAKKRARLANAGTAYMTNATPAAVHVNPTLPGIAIGFSFVRMP